VLRITSDTNVIVSALNFPGNPSRILDLAEAGEICLAVSDDILNEVNRVCPSTLSPSNDPTDKRILECAAASGSDYLVRGDNHLLKVGTHDYKRHGTATLFATLDAMEGSVVSMCEDRHRPLAAVALRISHAKTARICRGSLSPYGLVAGVLSFTAYDSHLRFLKCIAISPLSLR